MNLVEENDKISFILSREEAIVLFDWLSRFNEMGKSEMFHDQSEERVLWDMESLLERTITEAFYSNYSEILSKAREKVRD